MVTCPQSQRQQLPLTTCPQFPLVICQQSPLATFSQQNTTQDFFFFATFRCLLPVLSTYLTSEHGERLPEDSAHHRTQLTFRKQRESYMVNNGFVYLEFAFFNLSWAIQRPLPFLRHSEDTPLTSARCIISFVSLFVLIE